MRRGFLFSVAFSLAFCFLSNDVLHCQCASGLHAGIRAQQWYIEEPHVYLSFVLLNDSGSALDVHANSWKIVVNGTELKDSQWIFGNGPGPVGGYGTLKPGESYEFGKALLISKYFPHSGEYRIVWKGDGFESPTISMTISSPKPRREK